MSQHRLNINQLKNEVRFEKEQFIPERSIRTLWYNTLFAGKAKEKKVLEKKLLESLEKQNNKESYKSNHAKFELSLKLSKNFKPRVYKRFLVDNNITEEITTEKLKWDIFIPKSILEVNSYSFLATVRNNYYYFNPTLNDTDCIEDINWSITEDIKLIDKIHLSFLKLASDIEAFNKKNFFNHELGKLNMQYFNKYFNNNLINQTFSFTDTTFFDKAKKNDFINKNEIENIEKRHETIIEYLKKLDNANKK